MLVEVDGMLLEVLVVVAWPADFMIRTESSLTFRGPDSPETPILIAPSLAFDGIINLRLALKGGVPDDILRVGENAGGALKLRVT